MTSRSLVVARLADLPKDTNKAFKIEGQGVLLCRTEQGIFALENRCSHQLATLEGGRMRGVFLFCPKHSARFDMRTGAAAGQLTREPIRAYATSIDAEDNICIQWPDSSDSQHRQENHMSPEERNQQTVTEFLELFSSGDVGKTMAMFAEDATWWVAGTMPISGTYDKAAFTRLLGGVLETCTMPIRIKPLAFTVQGERVALEAESYTQTKTGRVYNNLYHFLFKVRDGKIAGVKEFLDTMHTNAVLCTP